jgi:hypothetical protein
MDLHCLIALHDTQPADLIAGSCSGSRLGFVYVVLRLNKELTNREILTCFKGVRLVLLLKEFTPRTAHSSGIELKSASDQQA